MKDIVLDEVYKDDNIIVINKPDGIEESELTDILRGSDEYPLPCHRLDRNTSGLIIYAKNKESLDILLEKFKNREIEKRYVCVVYGIPRKGKDILNAYLFKDSKKSLVYIYDIHRKGCVPICTGYSIIKKNIDKNISLLDVDLKTGKTHQIRAHLAHIGHPIIGDR